MDHWSSKKAAQTFSGHCRSSTASLSQFNRPGQRSYYMPALLMLIGAAWLGAAGCGSSGASPAAAATPSATPSPSSAFTICSGQTYALCAVASCFVLDGVAYCKCDVSSGDSISLTDAFGNDQNICTVNAQGAENGYMASTFSLPQSVVAPNGNQALYTCRAGTSTGAYAQCDGGLCFTSTKGQSFPGFNPPLTDSEIICSCPITVANPATAKIGYQIAGPYPCQKSFFQNCERATASTKNGSQIYVGATTGIARVLIQELDGSVPALNECLP
jgi:hypothetical protein